MSEEPENPISNVIQAFGQVANPKVASIIDSDLRSVNIERMLGELEVIRESVEKGEIDSMVLLAIGAPGHVDLSYISDAAWESAAMIGVMATFQSILIDALRQRVEGDEDDE